jgi:hypothetical protein
VDAEDIERAMRDYPGFVPGIAISVVVGLVICGPVARALRIGRLLAYALVLSSALILASTLTPGGDAPRHGTSSCDFSRLGPAPIADVEVISPTSLNVFLFIPLGTVLGLLPRSRRKTALVVMAIALPFVIETTQLLVVPLDRACQSADVADNLTGLAVGLLLGTIVGRAARRRLYQPRGEPDPR